MRRAGEDSGRGDERKRERRWCCDDEKKSDQESEAMTISRTIVSKNNRGLSNSNFNKFLQFMITTNGFFLEKYVSSLYSMYSVDFR